MHIPEKKGSYRSIETQVSRLKSAELARLTPDMYMYMSLEDYKIWLYLIVLDLVKYIYIYIT